MSKQKKTRKSKNEYQPTERISQADVGGEDKHVLGSVMFDRFEVFGVQHGGQGIVYLVEEIHSREKYAVKTFSISSPSKSSKDLQEFSDELNSLTEVPLHTNIVVPLSVEYHDEKPYIFMEYIPANLRERIGKLSFEEALVLAYQTCLAMDFIHNIRTSISVIDQPERIKRVQKGFNFPQDWRDESREVIISEEGYVGVPGRSHIIHGDLKPENVLITDAGLVKVADFGIAHLFDFASGSFIRQTNGTIPYMSPEHLRGEPLDERADVFSFGVMFYEMLQGSLPYPFDLLKLNNSERRAKLNGFYDEIDFYNDLTPPWHGIQNPSEDKQINDLVFSCLFPAANNRSPNFRTIRRKFEDLGLKPKDIYDDNLRDKSMDQYRKALLLYNMGRVKESLNLFNSALINNPNNPQIWAGAAFALNGLGEADLAENFLSRALETSMQRNSDKK